MAVQPAALARLSGRATVVGVSVAAIAVLGAGAARVLSGPAALAIGAGGAALWAGASLISVALAIHQAAGRPAPISQAAPRRAGNDDLAEGDDADGDFYFVCRGAGFVGLAALAAGLTTLVPLWSPWPAGVSAIVAYGLVATLYSIGILLLHVPGPGRRGADTGTVLGAGIAASDRSRGHRRGWALLLRRAFDGIGLGVSLAFAGHLIPSDNHQELVTLPVTVIGATGIAITTVAVLRGRPVRWTAVRCGAGATAVLVTLGILVTMTALGSTGIGLPLLGIPIVLGLAASVEGGARRERYPERVPRHPDQYLASYPLLAVPAGVGVIAAIWHLVASGTFDTTSIVLGISMVAVLATRELLVVRDLRRYAGQLQTAEAHFRSLVAGATDLTLVLDDRLRIQWQSPAASRLFGLSDDEVVGTHFLELIHPDDAADTQAVIDSVLAGAHSDGPPVLVTARMRDGAELWRDTESTIADQRAVPEVEALVVHVRDVGERKHLERTLHRLSYCDQLTGLANRRALMRNLLAYRRRPGQQGTLLVIDLHGLAEVNDDRGREIGDAALIEVSRRLRELLGAEDVAARLGGAEFAVLTADGAVLAYALATRIATVLAEPHQLPGAIVELHSSVGLAELAGGEDSDGVLRHADLARKRARQLGLDRVEWYDPDVEIMLNRRMDLEQQLIGAADRGELDLVFQPVVNLSDREPVGVEALLRWRHPQLGTILPNELLPIARAVGIAAEVDEWVLDAACKHLAAWSTGENGFWLSVNVAPRELLTARYPDRVAAALRRHSLPPERLIVEVAETWIAEDVPAIVASLAGLRRQGVRAALDDFGSGHASLSHLRRLPVDMLKLHSSLVNAPLDVAASAPAVIDVVVSLGRRLGLEIVAKGLESTELVERAARAGCPFGQGFALGRPAPAERIEAYLDTHRA